MRTTQLDACCLCDLSQLTSRCTTQAPALLCFSSHFFFSPFYFLVFSAHAGSECLCVCRLAVFIHVHHPRRRSKPVPKSLRRISCPSVAPPSTSLPFQHPDWAKALEQRAYRVARSLGISWGDPVSFTAQNGECEIAVSLVAEQQLPIQSGLTILVCCFGTVTMYCTINV